ncbi:hypothetical protein JTT01_03940 [Clostridium botulinum]|nr:hypothetical protein [Clostridium botulinum]MCS4524462.1 hypothetical protein [Clostridium botulinum]
MGERKRLKANEYVAIVQADGDSMGRVIEKFKIHNDRENIYVDYKDFSSKLLEYDKNSHEKLKSMVDSQYMLVEMIYFL